MRLGSGVKLLTEELKKKLPVIGDQDNKGLNAIAYIKFFTPWSNWSWFVTEFDGKDIFFGLVDGHFKELGYFSLSELQSIDGPWGLKIERDLYFKPAKLKVLM